jgi:hypothetical protein
VRRAPAEAKTFFSQWYHEGDMIAYALDPTRAAPLVEQRIQAAEAAALAKTRSASLDQQNAELIGNQGLTYDQLQAGVGYFAAESQTTSKLNAIYGTDVSESDLVKEIFADDTKAAAKRSRLASQERAAFKGTFGAGAAFRGDSGAV